MERKPRITTDDIRWELPPQPAWPESGAVLRATLAVLPGVDDDAAAGLLEAQARALVTAREQVAALATTVAALLDQLHTAQVNLTRLKVMRREERDAARRKAAQR